MVTGCSERSETRADRCESDLSGGTEISARRELAGAMRVVARILSLLSIGSSSHALLEDVKLLLGEVAVPAFGEATQTYGTYAYALEGEQNQPYRRARSAYYAVTAFVNRQVQGGCFGVLAEVLDPWGEHLAVFEVWASGEGGEAFVEVRLGGLQGQLVLLLYLGGGVGDMVS